MSISGRFSDENRGKQKGMGLSGSCFSGEQGERRLEKGCLVWTASWHWL